MGTCALVLCIAALGGRTYAPPQRVELASGYYLLARPADVGEGVELPLIVALHGTDDRADDAVAFWTTIEGRLPYVVVAPQGRFAGWRESDLPLLREMLDHLPGAVPYDRSRVLLAGHSAGGAMAFHLLYAEEFPASAVAVTANYLPPNVTLEQVRARGEVPAFYAVGTRDLNHERMRSGAALLREGGVRLTMIRPDIGHVQDAGVGRQALAWFEALCRERIEGVLERARRPDQKSALGPLLVELEDILQNEPAHFPDQVRIAGALALDLERPGRQRWDRAESLAGRQRFAEARDAYLEIERLFEPASLASRARAARLRLEARPEAAALPDLGRGHEDAEAERLWTLIDEARKKRDNAAAANYCREMLRRYPRSARAPEAAALLGSLQGAGS